MQATTASSVGAKALWRPTCGSGVPMPMAVRVASAAIAVIVSGAVHGQGLPFTESFDDTTVRDETQTHADWGASVPGELRMPSASPLADPFGPASAAEDMLGAYTTRVLALADLNGDGHLDLIEGASGRSGVYVSNGGGTFAARVDLEPVSANTRGIAAGDVDRDGDIDIVVGNLGNTSRLYLNAGDGMTFIASDLSPDVRQTDWIVLADVNGDGFLDAVTGNHNTTNRIYLNTGDPQQPFGAAGVQGTNLGSQTDNTQAIAAGDVDNDGDIDFVALNENQVNRLYLNDGTGGFTSAAIGTDADNSQGGVLGDLDGDGFLDLAVANGQEQDSKIYFNTGGSAPFDGVTGVPFATVADLDHARAIVLADADDDGDLDIFIGTAEETTPASRDNENFLYLNDGTGTFPTHVTIGTQAGITNALAVGDVDGDGDLDVIAGNETRDAQGTAGQAANRLYRNTGTDTGGGAVLQLRGVATSLRVDSETQPIANVRLDATPDTYGPNNRVQFWVSSNGGANWLQIVPGQAVEFPVALRGQDLRWRAVLNSLSPAADGGAAGLVLDSVTLALNGPAFTSTPPTTATVGTEYVYAVTASSPEGGDLTITAQTSPSWLTLTDNGSGSAELKGTPPEGSAGDHSVELQVQDSGGATAVQSFTITVAAGASSPPPPPPPPSNPPPSSGGGGGGGSGSIGLLELLIALLAAARVVCRPRRTRR